MNVKQLLKSLLCITLLTVFASAEQFTEKTGISLTGVYVGSVAWGDYDNDGDLDILLTGYDSNENEISKIYRNNGDNTFTEQTGISLTGVYDGSVAWGDYDNDGDLDILLTGSDNINYISTISKIYRNNGDNTFAEQTGISLTGVNFSSVAWGDYDNDGDLDILLTGRSGSGYFSKIYRNNNLTPNSAPTAPSGLSASTTGSDVTFSWNKSSDAETPQNGLSYNLYVGTSSHNGQVKSPMSDISSGFRRVVQIGNANQNNSWTFKNLPGGTYYWSVQAIDNSYEGSTFASEKTFTNIVIIEEVTSPIPSVYSLAQNYPNPFNPTTTILYQLPKSTYVKLSIYDITGKLVETLVNEHKNAGYYSVNWDATNVSSGIYIYKIDASNFSSVKKCLIVK